jgi:hypothetical protein
MTFQPSRFCICQTWRTVYSKHLKDGIDLAVCVFGNYRLSQRATFKQQLSVVALAAIENRRSKRSDVQIAFMQRGREIRTRRIHALPHDVFDFVQIRLNFRHFIEIDNLAGLRILHLLRDQTQTENHLNLTIGRHPVEPGRQHIKRLNPGRIIYLVHALFAGRAHPNEIQFPRRDHFSNLLPVAFRNWFAPSRFSACRNASGAFQSARPGRPPHPMAYAMLPKR